MTLNSHPLVTSTMCLKEELHDFSLRLLSVKFDILGPMSKLKKNIHEKVFDSVVLIVRFVRNAHKPPCQVQTKSRATPPLIIMLIVQQSLAFVLMFLINHNLRTRYPPK